MQKQLLLSLMLLLTGLSQISAQEKMPLYLGGQFSFQVAESGSFGQANNVPNRSASSVGLVVFPYALWEKPNGSGTGIQLGIGYGSSASSTSGSNENKDRSLSFSAAFFRRLLLNKNTATLKFWLLPQVRIGYGKSDSERTDFPEFSRKFYNATASAQIGLYYDINPKFRLTTAWSGINYTYQISKIEGVEGITYFHNLDANLRVNPSTIIFGVEMRLR